MGNAEIDEHLLQAARQHWKKVASVLSEAAEACGLGSEDWHLRRLAKRLRVLVKKGQLLANGNLYNWRASEVRRR